MQAVGFEFLLLTVEAVARLERGVSVEVQLGAAGEIPVASQRKVELHRHDEAEGVDAAELWIRSCGVGRNRDASVIVQEELIVAGHAVVAPVDAEAEAEERMAAHARGEGYEVAQFQFERLAHVDVDSRRLVDAGDESELERRTMWIGRSVGVGFDVLDVDGTILNIDGTIICFAVGAEEWNAEVPASWVVFVIVFVLCLETTGRGHDHRDDENEFSFHNYLVLLFLRLKFFIRSENVAGPSRYTSVMSYRPPRGLH